MKMPSRNMMSRKMTGNFVADDSVIGDLINATFVPNNYVGLWQRTFYENKAGQDTTSLVLWMQTSQQHADIRIPAHRPDFSNCKSLIDCTNNQLRWLATQQGFFGYTHIRDSVCEWRREIDFQPKNNTRDIADMVFDGENTLLETGIDTPYLEIWKKVENTHGQANVRTISGLNRQDETVTAYLLRTGNHMAYVRPRSVEVPNASSLLDAINMHQPSQEVLLDWLDVEISFGEMIDEMQWQVMQSTLPFVEGSLRDK